MDLRLRDFRNRHVEDDIEKQIIIAEKASAYANSYFIEQSTRFVNLKNYDDDYMDKYHSLNEIARMEWKKAEFLENEYQYSGMMKLFEGLHPETQYNANLLFDNFFNGDKSIMKELTDELS